MLIENVTPGGHWIALDLRAHQARTDKKSRSNNSAIGARVEIKTGRRFQQYVVGGTCGPVAAMPPLRFTPAGRQPQGRLAADHLARRRAAGGTGTGRRPA